MARVSRAIFRMDLKKKIIGLIGIPLALYLITAFYYPEDFKKDINKITSDIYDLAYMTNNDVMNADRDLYQSRMYYEQLQGDRLKGKAREDAVKAFEENLAQATERVQAAKQLVTAAGLINVQATEKVVVSDLFKAYEGFIPAWAEQARQVIKANGYGTPAMDKLFDQGREGLNAFSDLVDGYTKQSIDDVRSENAKMVKVNYSVTVIFIVLLILLIFVSIRKINRNVTSAVGKMSSVMAGDLTSSAESKYGKDELGHILRDADTMITRLKSIVGVILVNTNKVAVSSEALYTASKETSDSAKHVAEHIQDVTYGTEIQAKSAEETSRAIEEMTAGILRIADNTTSMADHSAETTDIAAEGREALDLLGDQMREVVSIITELSHTIETLSHRSGQINQIADQITAFSSQTNILSLNASIEAARAGEHGKGFAVVADEIRKLAAQSIESADTIRDLVDQTRKDITGASHYMGQTMREVERSSERMQSLDEKFSGIAGSVRVVAEQLQENAAIAEQMSASAEQVSASMEHSSAAAADNLGKVQSVAAATEEQMAMMANMAESAEQLQVIVQDLNSVVSKFKVE
ncbi:methyl-accepting chemotaxis protein [Paenibacillus sp. MMS18-CY102]|uniref:methyl-accepting chemotaxis protein n=1 Tax=Paenibacillus sp. MMS18-CY102 TaxID=2682849 RepID=UPI001365556D|nr:methyl-accepting chemotaxis protein [Paenibacillus sp. MMS18-CY102]MWC27408.1 HAMP domain-containing protein [Paenibacillus sp. MMS18-CY102]